MEFDDSALLPFTAVSRSEIGGHLQSTENKWIWQLASMGPMISGHADEEVRDRAIENGAIACLPKPTDSGHLLDIVRWALKTDPAK